MVFLIHTELRCTVNHHQIHRISITQGTERIITAYNITLTWTTWSEHINLDETAVCYVIDTFYRPPDLWEKSILCCHATTWLYVIKLLLDWTDQHCLNTRARMCLYIYIYIYCSGTLWPMAGYSVFDLTFLDHTQRRTTFGRTPLVKWSAHSRETAWQQTPLTWDEHPCTRAECEPTIPARVRPLTYALDRAATGTG